MNFNFYIFGNPQGRYSQYPQDYTRDIFTPHTEGLTGSRAIIYRHLDLMHYIFIENLGDGRYIGLCLIFNHIRAKYVKNLFEFLRQVIETQAVENRKFLEYSDNGDITFSRAEFCDDLKSYDYLKSVINARLDARNNNFGLEELATKYSGASKTEYVDSSALNKEILRLSETCDKVVIEDNAGIQDTPTQQTISHLQRRLLEKDDTIDELSQKVSSLEKKKKQYRKVIFLFIVVLGCCAGLCFLYASLNKTEEDLRKTSARLSDAHQALERNRLTISELNGKVSGLTSSLEKETRLRNQAEATLDNIKSASPVIFTGGSYSFGSSEYQCNYYSAAAGTRTFRIKVIDESDGRTCVTKEISPYLEEGNGSFTVYIGRRLDNSQWYTFEIWYGGRLAGGSRH